MGKNKLALINKIRIIGGQWRSRRITFPDIPGLRPSLDRIRETAFNWLMPFIPGAKCLDLFAGSGALGFEALSRGAQFCCFVDNNPRVLACLHENAATLAIPTNQYLILRAQAPKKMPLLPNKPYDIIFLDPPFHQNLLNATIPWLTQNQVISAQTLIYMEMEKNTPSILSPAWEIIRRQETSRIIFQLAKLSNPQ